MPSSSRRRNSAQVRIYDPNDPQASRDGNAAITFLLDKNSYVYEPLGETALKRTTVVAVRQAAYRDGRTALLAATASALMAALESLRVTQVRPRFVRRMFESRATTAGQFLTGSERLHRYLPAGSSMIVLRRDSRFASRGRTADTEISP